MIAAAAALTAELDAEAPATRRVLERVATAVPAERFDFRPHPRSMSLAQLSHHVATIPGAISRIAALDGMDAATVSFVAQPAESPAALLPALDASLAAAREFLAGLDEQRAAAPWRMTHGEREVFTMPRIALMRTLALNHWYHHRGQLLVYLRLLDVPVPIVYGRTADENPFVQPA
jgi:uncharacterized damage-inducible protein DinB